MIIVGVLLLSGLLLVGVEAVGYGRGGYNSAFWRLSLDAKLDHVSEHRWEWWWISIWGLFGLFLLTGGVGGLTFLLADAGEPVLAFVALGGYLVALFAWVFGVIVQAAALSRAAEERVETGETPAWLHPLWRAGYVAEAVWVIGANLAYALFGAAVLGSGLVAGWAGWVAIIAGVLIPVIVVITRSGFPQLGVLIPAVLGIALLLGAG
jgi:hypothetical protein